MAPWLLAHTFPGDDVEMYQDSFGLVVINRTCV